MVQFMEYHNTTFFFFFFSYKAIVVEEQISLIARDLIIIIKTN